MREALKSKAVAKRFMSRSPWLERSKRGANVKGVLKGSAELALGLVGRRKRLPHIARNRQLKRLAERGRTNAAGQAKAPDLL